MKAEGVKAGECDRYTSNPVPSPVLLNPSKTQFEDIDRNICKHRAIDLVPVRVSITIKSHSFLTYFIVDNERLRYVCSL